MQNFSTTTSGGKTKIKMVLLGQCGVGKSSLIQKYIHNKFQQTMQSTVGIDFLAKNLCFKGKTYRLQLWDTAGQERFRSLIPGYLKQAIGAIIVFDVTRKITLLKAAEWLRIFSKHKNVEGYCMLVGNKTDMSYRQVTKEEGSNMAEELNMGYMEVSAKTGDNVELLFQQIISELEDGKTNGIKMGSLLDQVNEEEEEKDGLSRNEPKKKVEVVVEDKVKETEKRDVRPTQGAVLVQVPVSQPNIILNSRELQPQVIVQRGCCA